MSMDLIQAATNRQPSSYSLYKNAAEKKIKKIPRPMNAFMIFATEHRQRIKKAHPEEHNKQISIRLGKAWSELPAEERRRYQQRAQRVEREHNMKYPDYHYEPRPKYYKLLKKSFGDRRSNDRKLQDIRALVGGSSGTPSKEGALPPSALPPPQTSPSPAAGVPTPSSSTASLTETDDEDSLVWVPCHRSFAEKLGWPLPLLPKVCLPAQDRLKYEFRDGILVPCTKDIQVPQEAVTSDEGVSSTSRTWTSSPVLNASVGSPGACHPVQPHCSKNGTGMTTGTAEVVLHSHPAVHIVQSPSAVLTNVHDQDGAVQMYKVPKGWSNLEGVSEVSHGDQTISFEGQAPSLGSQPVSLEGEEETYPIEEQTVYLTGQTGTIEGQVIPFGSHPIISEDQADNLGNQVTLLVGAIEDPDCKEVTIKLQAYSSDTPVDDLTDAAKVFPAVGGLVCQGQPFLTRQGDHPLGLHELPWGGHILQPAEVDSQVAAAGEKIELIAIANQSITIEDLRSAGWNPDPGQLGQPSPDPADHDGDSASVFDIKSLAHPAGDDPVLLQVSGDYAQDAINAFQTSAFQHSQDADSLEDECQQAARYLDNQELGEV